MSKLKQKYLAFKIAEREFNKRKVNLANEFSKELHKACGEGNMKRFEILGKELINTLGKEHQFTVSSIKVLYEMQPISAKEN